MASKELEDLLEKRKELDAKLKMHAASMGGNRMPKKQKKVATLLADVYKLDGVNISKNEAESLIEKEPTETIESLTAKTLAMAEGIMKSNGVQDMVSNPIMSTAVNNKTTESPAAEAETTDTEPKQRKEKKTRVSIKKDPLLTSVSPGSHVKIRAKDSAADILGKIFNKQQEYYSWDKKKFKKDKIYRKSLDDQKQKHLEETIEALTGKKPSLFGKASRAKTSGLFKFGLLGAGAAAGSLLLANKAFANIDWSKMIPNLGFDNNIVGATGQSKDIAGARNASEEYLGRKMSDREWETLLKTTAAESTNNSTEQAMVMATILNRAKKRFGGQENSVIKAVEEPGQFQSVTGTKVNPGPSAKFKEGPSEKEIESINFGALNVLFKVSKDQEYFVAESNEAYKAGTSTSLRDRMREEGKGGVVGGSRFNTKPPSMFSFNKKDGNLSGEMSEIKTSDGKKAMVAKEHAHQFQGFINELETSGYSINSLGGFNKRNIAGSNVESEHARGLSIDVNPSQNPMKRGELVTNMPSNVGDIAKKYGLGWGGNWTTKKDPMHFSVASNEGGAGAGVKFDIPTQQNAQLDNTPKTNIFATDSKFLETMKMKKLLNGGQLQLSVLNKTNNVINGDTNYQVTSSNQNNNSDLYNKQYGGK